MCTADCPIPELCELLDIPFHSKLYAIWMGRAGSPDQHSRYRNLWCHNAGVSLQEAYEVSPWDGEYNEPEQPFPTSRIGVVLSRIIARETGKEVKCGPCLEEIRRLDQLTAEQVEQDRAEIIDGIMERGRHQLKWWTPKGFAVRMVPEKVRVTVSEWLDEAIQEGDLTAQQHETRSDSRHSLSPIIHQWAVGVTTAPRPVATVSRTVESLKQSGFHPIVFAEPRSDVNLDCLVIERQHRLGCWRNYVQTIKDLLQLRPQAEAIAIFQDDIVVCRDLRDFLEHDLWPSAQTGVVSLYSAEEYEAGESVGIDRRGKMILGLCAAIYPRHIAEKLVSDEYSKDWRGCHAQQGYVDDPVKKKAADTWVAESLKKMNKKVYHYRPSLAQHVAETSAIGHGGNAQIRQRSGKLYRKSKYFVGEDVSVFDVWKDAMPWCRWSVPQGHQRYREVSSLPKRPVTVVIPGYGCPDLTEKCLRRLELSTLRPSVIYSDDGSSPEDYEQIKSIKTSLDVKYIRSDINQGFAAACNAGIAASNPDSHVLLLNNDTLIGAYCIEKLRYHAELHLPAGAVGPVTGDDGNQSVRKQEIRSLTKWKGSLERDRYDPEVERHLTRHLVQPRSILSGFCMFMPRTALDRIGPLSTDKDFAAGLGADDEWCIRAERHGLVNMLVCNAWCVHLHKQTFRRMGVDRSRLQRQAARKLKGIR